MLKQRLFGGGFPDYAPRFFCLQAAGATRQSKPCPCRCQCHEPTCQILKRQLTCSGIISQPAMDGEHHQYTARLQAAVGLSNFEIADGRALRGVQSSASAIAASSSECCSKRGPHSIAATAAAQKSWFGDLECVQCSECIPASPIGRLEAGEMSGMPASNIAVMVLGHRRRLLFDTIATRVVAPSVQQGHAVTVFAYLENGTMATPYLSAGGSIQEHVR